MKQPKFLGNLKEFYELLADDASWISDPLERTDYLRKKKADCLLLACSLIILVADLAILIYYFTSY